MGIGINLDRAKSVAHDIRRRERAKEFAPLDIAATIPAQAAGAEASREQIREKYSVLQDEIITARDVDALTEIVKTMQGKQ